MPENENALNLVLKSIIQAFNDGVIPWHRPWGPINLSTGRPYRGTNAMSLQAASRASPYWVTFNQARELGFPVRKGEKGRPIVVWATRDTDEALGRDGNSFNADSVGYFLRHAKYVFNAEQLRDCQIKQPLEPLLSHKSFSKVQELVTRHNITVSESRESSEAYYLAEEDRVLMPRRELFHSESHYNQTLFHLFIHWTGSPDRLNRSSFSQTDLKRPHFFSEEELIAEIGTALLSYQLELPIEAMQNCANYLSGWKARISADPALLARCGGAAQRSVDCLLATLKT